MKFFIKCSNYEYSQTSLNQLTTKYAILRIPPTCPRARYKFAYPKRQFS